VVCVACLAFLTAPARACDDRFIKKCEKASAAAAAAETVATPTRRLASKRVRVVASRQARHSRLLRHVHGPRFARGARPVAEDQAERTAALPPRSALSRRFQGFIDPQPIAQNDFEALRKPQAIALDFDAAPILPPAEGGEVVAQAAPAASAAVATTPKHVKMLSKPASLIALASAESRPVVLADLSSAKAAMTAAAVVAPAIATEASSAPPDQEKSRFSFHGLVLALCGALGAASALRFVVGA